MANLMPEVANFRLGKINMRSKRACEGPEMVYIRPGRVNFRPERANLRPEKAD